MPWSYSAKDTYDRCPYRYKLRYIDRIPEPEPGPKDPRARGSEIHLQLEMYVDGRRPDVPEEGKHFQKQLIHLRDLYQSGMVELEGTWLFNNTWQTMPATAYKESWLVVKADVWVNNGTTGVMIDHKTGKKFGNEIKHAQQINLYSIAAFFRYPELHTINGEVWYHDANDVLLLEYRRDVAMKFLPRLEASVQQMLTDPHYRPRPNIHSCNYCPYGRKGNGHCPVAA